MSLYTLQHYTLNDGRGCIFPDWIWGYGFDSLICGLDLDWIAARRDLIGSKKLDCIFGFNRPLLPTGHWQRTDEHTTVAKIMLNHFAFLRTMIQQNWRAQANLIREDGRSERVQGQQAESERESDFLREVNQRELWVREPEKRQSYLFPFGSSNSTLA